MDSANELKNRVNTKTVNLALLTFATVGIYPIMWLFKNNNIIAKVTKIEIANSSFIIWIAVCLGIGRTLAGNIEPAAQGIGGILSLAVGVLYIVWSFKAKKALQNYATNVLKIDLQMNTFYTVFFTIYYVNYCINNLADLPKN